MKAIFISPSPSQNNSRIIPLRSSRGRHVEQAWPDIDIDSSNNLGSKSKRNLGVLVDHIIAVAAILPVRAFSRHQRIGMAVFGGVKCQDLGGTGGTLGKWTAEYALFAPTGGGEYPSCGQPGDPCEGTSIGGRTASTGQTVKVARCAPLQRTSIPQPGLYSVWVDSIPDRHRDHSCVGTLTRRWGCCSVPLSHFSFDPCRI